MPHGFLKKAHSLNNRRLLHGVSNFHFVVWPHRNVLLYVRIKESDRPLSKREAAIYGPPFRTIRKRLFHSAAVWGDDPADATDTLDSRSRMIRILRRQHGALNL